MEARTGPPQKPGGSHQVIQKLQTPTPGALAHRRSFKTPNMVLMVFVFSSSMGAMKDMTDMTDTQETEL